MRFNSYNPFKSYKHKSKIRNIKNVETTTTYYETIAENLGH